MKMFFYVIDDLEDLERSEEELESAGVHWPQIHVFNRNDSEVETHGYPHDFKSVFKQNVVYGTTISAWIGTRCAISRNSPRQIFPDRVSAYFRLKKIPCGFKQQARARHTGEKYGLARISHQGAG